MKKRQKGLILAPRSPTPKWTSLDLLRVLARGICGTLFPSVHRPHFLTHPPSLSLAVYFLCSPTRAFNHEITISSCPSSTLDGSVRREATLEVRDQFRKVGQPPPNHIPKTTKLAASAKSLWDRYVVPDDLQVVLRYL